MEQTQWLEEQRRIRAAVRDRRFASRAVAGHRGLLASVIVACRNEQDVIGRCLEHLLAQDYADREIVVVDDGSTDRTPEIAHRMLAGGGGKLVINTGRHGLARARNLGIGHVRGEIVAFVDADGYAERDWLREIVASFAGDETVGAVASTVLYSDNPLVINGAGGTVNQRCRAADLAMNESYEHAELARAALYAMGCGMAFRRAALDRVGPFDERIVNYYDDVDYGIRIWRAGYRLTVARRALVEHDYDAGEVGSPRRRRLSERHRMRTLLKHGSLADIRTGLWPTPGFRISGLDALAWNLQHLASLVNARRRLRLSPPAPDALLDPSPDDAFPTGLPPARHPRVEAADDCFRAAEDSDSRQLVHGWFGVETRSGASYVWAAPHSALLIRLKEQAHQLTIRFAHAPEDTGGIEVSVRRLGFETQPVVTWRCRLEWHYIERSLENHPLSLPPGMYEVLFDAEAPWTDPPIDTRSLAFALSRLSFETPSVQLKGDVDMSEPSSELQLLHGWFEAEGGPELIYRWGGQRAALAVRSAEPVSGMFLRWRMPPDGASELEIAVCPTSSTRPVWSTHLRGPRAEWDERTLDVALDAGSYVVSFRTKTTWSNSDGRDPSLPPERRALGFALSTLRLERRR
jgi:GT2 family glycosyltransferase